MKTLTFKPPIACLVIGLMAGVMSCEKSMEEPESTTTESSNNQISEPEMGNAKTSSRRHLYMYINCDPVFLGDPCITVPLFCAWPPGTCLPTVVVRGIQGSSDLDNLLGHIDNDTYDEFFSGPAFERTFGIIRDYPNMHKLLKEKKLSFVVEQSDTLDQHLYLVGFDAKVDPTKRTENDVLLTFEIDEN